MLTIKHHVSCIHSPQIFVRLQPWISSRNGHSHCTDNTELPVNWMCSEFRRKLEYMDSSEPKCNGSTFRNWTWRLKSWRIRLMKMEGGRSRNRLIRPWNTEEGTVPTLDKVVERYSLHESLNKCIRKEYLYHEVFLNLLSIQTILHKLHHQDAFKSFKRSFNCQVWKENVINHKIED